MVLGYVRGSVDENPPVESGAKPHYGVCRALSPEAADFLQITLQLLSDIMQKKETKRVFCQLSITYGSLIY